MLALQLCLVLTLAVDIVDIKPANMEELTEVITAAEFHPHHCNLFVYSSSKSNMKLADMRDSALCDQHAKREYAPISAATTRPHNMCGSVRGGGPIKQVILLGNYFIDLRRQVQPRRAIHPFAGLPLPQDLGYQYGVEARKDHQHSRPLTRETLRSI